MYLMDPLSIRHRPAQRTLKGTKEHSSQEAPDGSKHRYQKRAKAVTGGEEAPGVLVVNKGLSRKETFEAALK